MKRLKLIDIEKFYQVSRYIKGGLTREVKRRLLMLRYGYKIKVLKW